MYEGDSFIQAYREFRRTVDLTKGGVIPELDTLVWCLLLGIPEVPASEDSSKEAALRAVDQRVAILKAIFVEVNGNEPDPFLDLGMVRYDQAGRKVKTLLGAVADADARPGDPHPCDAPTGCGR